MLVKDYDKALELARNASPGQSFLVTGEEPYQALCLEKALEVRARALELEPARLDGEEAVPGVVKRLACEGSLFGSGRYLRIRNVDSVPVRSQPEVLEAVQNGSSHLFLHLTLRQGPNLAFLKRLAENAVVFQCWEPFEGRMAPWVRRLAGEMKVRLDRSGAETAEALSYGKLLNLAGILERLALRYGPETPVQAEHVLTAFGGPPECNALDMARCAVSGDGKRALTLMAILLSSGEEPIRLLALIHSQWVQAVTAAGHLRRGKPHRDLPSLLGLTPFRAKWVLEAAEAWKRRPPGPVAEAFAETDARLKRGWNPLDALAPFLVYLTLPPEGRTIIFP